jgi:hypothetical protein
MLDTGRRSVSVTLKNINDSIPANSSHCMIADAIKRSFPESRNISVDIQTIRWSEPKKRQRYIFLTPARAQRAIIDFDEGKKPKAFRFYLRGGQVIAMKKMTKEDKKRLDGVKQRPTIVHDEEHLPRIEGGIAPRMTHVGKRRVFGLRTITGLKESEHE